MLARQNGKVWLEKMGSTDSKQWEGPTQKNEKIWPQKAKHWLEKNWKSWPKNGKDWLKKMSRVDLEKREKLTRKSGKFWLKKWQGLTQKRGKDRAKKWEGLTRKTEGMTLNMEGLSQNKVVVLKPHSHVALAKVWTMYFFKWLKVKLLNITYLIFFFFLAHCLGIRTIWRTKSQTCLFMYFSRFSVFPNTSNRIYVLWSWSWCPITSTILLINWFLDIFPWIFNFECIWKIYLLFYC